MGQLTVLCRNCFGFSQHDPRLAGQNSACPKCGAVLPIPIPTALPTAVESLRERAKQPPPPIPPIIAKVVRPPSGVGLVTKIALSVGFGGFILIVLCCGGVLTLPAIRGPVAPPAPGRPVENREVLAAGSKAYLWIPGEPVVMVPVDDAAHDEMIRMHRAGNKEGIAQLMGQDRLMVVTADTPVTIVQAGFLSHRVRMLDGYARGHEGVVAVEFVHSMKSR